MVKLICPLWLLSTLTVFAQWTYYAPDLRGGADRTSYLCLVNPGKETATFTVTGYQADGVAVGTRGITLPSLGRFESNGADLIDTGPVAWARVEAAHQLVGYVRYETPNGPGMVSLNRVDGDALWVPQLLQDDFFSSGSEVVLVNTSDREGTTLADPERANQSIRRLLGPATIESLAKPFSQGCVRYDSLYEKYNQDMFWDKLTSEVSLAGVQHFGLAGPDAGMASMQLMRTPIHEMIVTPLHPDTRNFKTHFVLINTTDEILPVVLTVYDQALEAYEIAIDLEPFEKRTYTFNDQAQLAQPFFPRWYRIEAHEFGLVGFQYVATKTGKAMAAMSEAHQPGSEVVLPFTPNPAGGRTVVGFINPTGINAHLNIYGMNDEGKVVARKRGQVIKPNEKIVTDTAELFGAAADKVTWVRVLALNSLVTAYALVTDDHDKQMQAEFGKAVAVHDGSFAVSNFEFQRTTTLKSQNWVVQGFNTHFYYQLIEADRDHFHDSHSMPVWGEFFTEAAFDSDEGNLYLGYEPAQLQKIYPFEGRIDHVALRSPYIELPPYGDFYLSYLVRFIDPLNAAPGSRYGLAWREEGSATWHWFGVTGELLLDAPFPLNDCWVPVCYRSLHNEVTLTGWQPFETKLPDGLGGKRIQVAYYYEHHHLTGYAEKGPTFFIDAVRLSEQPTAHTLFYEEASGTIEEIEE